MEAPEVITVDVQRVFDRSWPEKVWGRIYIRSFVNAQHNVGRPKVWEVTRACPLPAVIEGIGGGTLANANRIACPICDRGHVDLGIHVQASILAARFLKLVGAGNSKIGSQSSSIGCCAACVSPGYAASDVGWANKDLIDFAIVAISRWPLPPRPLSSVERAVQTLPLTERQNVIHPAEKRPIIWVASGGGYAAWWRVASEG